MSNTLFDDRQAARLALRCLDLTSLRDDDTDASVEALAQRADTPHGAPAALCIYPRFVPAARRALDARRLQRVKVATVVNFPRGDATPEAAEDEIHAALAAGADEIDLVFPWRALLAGDSQVGGTLLARARLACGTEPLKVILETGELKADDRIREAAAIALDAGADFLKTSTGKVAVNATPQAVAVVLDAIVERGARAGLKVAGGVATLDDVQRYLALAAAAYGAERVSPATLRFGASSLLPVLLAVLDGQAPPTREAGY